MPDLAESTNVIGFMEDFEGDEGTGWHNRDTNPIGAFLLMAITDAVL